MILKVCGIKDVKTSSFFGVSTFQNEAVFVRNVQNAVLNDNGSLLHTNTKDFDLYTLGTFDTESGELVPDVSFVCNCTSLED